MPSPAAPDVAALSYEQALGELEAIVAALEGGELPLEETLALFERGQALANRCSGLLDQVELRILQLSNGELHEFTPPA
jgi:exodeoxyribonuclease VII small subunit